MKYYLDDIDKIKIGFKDNIEIYINNIIDYDINLCCKDLSVISITSEMIDDKIFECFNKEHDIFYIGFKQNNAEKKIYGKFILSNLILFKNSIGTSIRFELHGVAKKIC